MKVVLQALKLGFWALPAQRVLVVAGAVSTVLALWLWPPWRVWGVLLLVLPALAMGGPLWRAISAQRAAALAPGSRAKLLGAAIVIAVLSSLVMAIVELSYYYPWASQHPRLGWRYWWLSAGLIGVETFVFASWWAIASFAAARSALAMFAVVMLAIGAGYAGTMLDLRELGLQTSLPFRVAVVVLAWLVFGGWYLTRRHIARSAWLSRGGAEAFFVTSADTSTAAAGIARGLVIEQLLCGGASVLRRTVQWLLVMLVLLGVQLALVRVEDAGDARLLAKYLLASLLLTVAAMAMLSDAAASRLRTLWLPAGYSRASLFAEAERRLWKLAAGLGAVAAVLLAALWYSQSWHPEAPLAYGLASLLVLLMIPAYGALWGVAAWRWIVAILLVVALRATYWQHFVQGEPGANWWWLALPVAATVALRMLARRRWLGQDMPRSVTSMAF